MNDLKSFFEEDEYYGPYNFLLFQCDQIEPKFYPFPSDIVRFTDDLLPEPISYDDSPSLESVIGYYCCLEAPIYFKIHKNVREIGRRALTHIYEIDPENQFYTMENGIIYNKNKTKILYGGLAKGNIKIPEGIKELPQNVFLNKTRGVFYPDWSDEETKKDETLFLSIPASMEYIANDNFQYISSISPYNKNYVMKDSIILSIDGKKIYYYGKESLDVVIPEGVELINREAFYYGKKNNLKLSIDKSLNGTADFLHIQNIQIPKTLKSLGENFFSGIIHNFPIKFVVHSENQYFKTYGDNVLLSKDGKMLIFYSKPGDIIIPDGVENINLNQFIGDFYDGDGELQCGLKWCYYNYKIYIPSSVKDLGDLFYYMDHIYYCHCGYEDVINLDIIIDSKNPYFQTTKDGKVVSKTDGKIIYDPQKNSYEDEY